MGTDKASLLVNGRTMLDRVLDGLMVLDPVETLVVGGPVRIFDIGGRRHVVDTWPGEGPLGGVVTALRASSSDLVVVVPCDVPDLAGAATLVLMPMMEALAQDSSLDVVVPVIDRRRQLAVAAYRRRAGEALTVAFEAGARSLRVGLRGLSMGELPVTASVGRLLVDVDTPEEFDAWCAASPGPRDVVQ